MSNIKASTSGYTHLKTKIVNSANKLFNDVRTPPPRTPQRELKINTPYRSSKYVNKPSLGVRTPFSFNRARVNLKLARYPRKRETSLPRRLYPLHSRGLISRSKSSIELTVPQEVQNESIKSETNTEEMYGASDQPRVSIEEIIQSGGYTLQEVRDRLFEDNPRQTEVYATNNHANKDESRRESIGRNLITQVPHYSGNNSGRFEDWLVNLDSAFIGMEISEGEKSYSYIRN